MDITNLVPRSHSVRECRTRNVRSGKVRYKAISGWLIEERMAHSNLFCDWLFPSPFGCDRSRLFVSRFVRTVRRRMEKWTPGKNVHATCQVGAVCAGKQL